MLLGLEPRSLDLKSRDLSVILRLVLSGLLIITFKGENDDKNVKGFTFHWKWGWGLRLPMLPFWFDHRIVGFDNQ